MLSFFYVYSDHSILECYNLFSGVELSMRSFFVIIIIIVIVVIAPMIMKFCTGVKLGIFYTMVIKSL